jgi:hypothetical protein
LLAVVTFNIAFAVPFELSVTVDGEILAIGPILFGETEFDNVRVPEYPFVLVNVTVDVALLP